MLAHYILAPIAVAVLAGGWILVERWAKSSLADDCDAPEGNAACGGCSQTSCASRVD